MTKHLCDACKGDISTAKTVIVAGEPFEVCLVCATKLVTILRDTHTFKHGRPAKNPKDREAWRAA